MTGKETSTSPVWIEVAVWAALFFLLNFLGVFAPQRD